MPAAAPVLDDLSLLLETLLPLAFEQTWHPVRSLAVAPDLPDDWWTQVQPYLDADRRPHPAALAALREHWQTRWPRRYRAAGLAAGQAQVTQGDVTAGARTLGEVGAWAEARRAVEAWMSARFRAGEHRAILDVARDLPAEAVDVRVRAVMATARLSVGDAADAALVRAELNAAYLDGERDTRFLYTLAHTCQLDGEHTRALALIEEALALPDPHDDRLMLLQLQGVLHGYLWQLEAQAASARTLIEAARAAGDLYFEAVGTVSLGYALEDLGDFGAAENEYRHAARLMRQLNQGPQLATLLNNWAQSLVAAHRPHEALQRLAQAAALPGLQVRHHGWLTGTRTMVLHQLGRRDEALTNARQAARLLRQAHLPGDEVWVQCLRAQEAALVGGMSEAREALKEAEDLGVRGGAHAGLLQFSRGVVAYHAGDMAGAAGQFTGLDETPLTKWNVARLALYRLALQRRAGKEPMVDALDAALVAAGGDGPLRTDGDGLQDTLAWLGTQPGWADRLSAAFGVPVVQSGVPLHLELLGPLALRSPGGEVRFRLRRSLELLAVLILFGPQTRAQLIAHLWDGEVDARTLDLFKKALRSARGALASLLPEGEDPVPVQDGRYALHGQFTVTVTWRPPGFPAPGVRQAGPIEVRGAFADGAQGPWADEVRSDVHEILVRELKDRWAGGDHTVTAALNTAQHL